MKRILNLFLVTLFFSISQIYSQDQIPKRQYFTRGIDASNAPQIDGLLKDEAWALVDWSGNYIQWSPNENTKATEETKLKILYDEKNLYVAFRCYDTDPKGIVNRLSRRDGFDGDWVEINIDSYHDLRTAFSFTITVAGVKGDEFITNNGANWDNTWNPIWYAETHIDNDGWTAEIRIPLSQLRFSDETDQVWGIQSTRRYFRNEERSVWQRSPQNAAGWVSSFGELHGLKNLKAQKQLEVQPYLVSDLTRFEAEKGNPFRDGSNTNIDFGLDGKLGITNDLTLDFTINPDFGQVEADPSAITLDGFQIFFPEQRPFFIENKNIFDYRFSLSKATLNTFGFDNLFYSRRIGRAPQGSPKTGGNDFVDQAITTTILGAAKLSGKTKGGWSIGILEALTNKEEADVFNLGNKRKETVEPLTNYFVSRVQKDFNNGNTFFGGIFTATNRDIKENVNFLHKSAYTAGLDLTHQWDNKKWYVKANLIYSHVRGSKEAIQSTQQSIRRLFQRVDASYLELDTNATSLSGTGGTFQYGKASGNWRFETGATWRSPELELNDVGFQSKADDIRNYSWIQYRTTKALKSVRLYAINFSHVMVHDFGGHLNELYFRLNGWVNLKNNWWLNGGIAYSPIQFSNSSLRSGPRLKRGNRINYAFGTISDARKKLRFALNYNETHGDDDEFTYHEIGGSITYQPTNALQVSLLPKYIIKNDNMQYVTTNVFNGAARYITAHIEQEVLNLPLRVDYILTPNLSIQYWGQPFIFKARYNNFKRITNPIADRYNDQFLPLGDQQLSLNNGLYEVDENEDSVIDYSFFQPDFASVQWLSNLVLRWEYTPGSEIFFVWSQSIAQFGDFRKDLFASLRDNIINTQPQNIFLLKATYRFNR